MLLLQNMSQTTMDLERGLSNAALEVQNGKLRISLNPTLEFGTALVRDGESMSTLPGIVRMKPRSSRAVSCD